MNKQEFKELFRKARAYQSRSWLGAQGLPCGADDAYLERRHNVWLSWLDEHPIIKRVFEMRGY